MIAEHNTAKPIVVIYVPHDFKLEGERESAPVELMRALNGNYGYSNEENKAHNNYYWSDYYWFSFYKDEITEPEFKIFYSKDFTEIQYAELKGEYKQNSAACYPNDLWRRI